MAAADAAVIETDFTVDLPQFQGVSASTVPARLAVIGAAALVLIALAVAAHTIWIAFVTHSPLPQLDEWDNLAVFRAIVDDGLGLRRFFTQHNEHRIFFPRFILFSDYMFFGGRGTFDVIAIVLVQSLQSCLFVYLLVGSYPRRAPLRSIMLGATSTVLLFSLLQSENFNWGFQIQFVGVFAAASLSVTLFSTALSQQRLGRRSMEWIVMSFGLAGIASFSMANGLVAGPVLIVLAILARAPRRYVIGTIVLTGSLTALFLTGYNVRAYAGADATLPNKALRVLVYTCAYLGNMLDPDVSAAIGLGACGLAATAAMGLRLALYRDADPARLALFGIATFAAGSAFVTAVGRSVDGIDGAMASRYVTGTACFWSAVLIAGWSWSAELRWPVMVRLPIGAAALILLNAALEFQATGVSIQEDRRYKYNIIEDALLQNLYDVQFLLDIDESPGILRDIAPMLRARKLSIYSGRDAQLWGRPLTEAGDIDQTPCGGSFDEARASAKLGPNGADVHGRVGLRPAFSGSRRIYIVDSSRTIVGYASTPFRSGEWKGYATVPAGSPVQAFARRGSGRLCFVGSTTVSAAVLGSYPGDRLRLAGR